MHQKEKRLCIQQLIHNEKAVDELVVYAQHKFTNKNSTVHTLPKEFIETWERYHEEAQTAGAFATLKKYLVQLQFPITKGISQTEAYKNVTLRGKQKTGTNFLQLQHPDEIELVLYESPMIGKIPVLIVPNTDDFTTIICALANKNEPKAFPASMGALCINGLNNWHRIHSLKAAWLQKNPLGNWNEFFKKQVAPKPHLYKDKIIVLSKKGYSGVQSHEVRMTDAAWKNASLIIRREHECAHIFTLQHYGSMANNMHDEIIADYAGITKVLGRFDKEWFLRFMGLENYPNYRNGGRLQNYQSPIALSEEAFKGLQMLIYKISDTLVEFDTALGNITSAQEHVHRIQSICEVDMITLASTQGLETLHKTYNRKKVLTA
ncbi:hypothetical protein KORDIASMS9_01235 [Kordia sp. SMS9]|nr:hypothetical protein KORDIASMS9_01235 [Kordia sp. SMS9]